MTLQKSPTSIGGKMNADLSCFSTGVQTPVPAVSLTLHKTSVADATLSLPKHLLKEV